MDLSNNPGSLIARLAHAMANELDSKLRVHGVTISQWMLLKQVWEQEGRSQVELQELLGLEGATVSGLIQRMTNLGLVCRQPDPSDKRVQRVFLTERGRALECVTAPLDEVNEHAFKGFTADERDFFIRLLSRALHNFDER
ncbi:MAG TPA: MarR family transcriptional regulator [Ktedonobacteraceae bacterium]|jgi:DNA-binding MarR family transcriptional regulator